MTKASKFRSIHNEKQIEFLNNEENNKVIKSDLYKNVNSKIKSQI